VVRENLTKIRTYWRIATVGGIHLLALFLRVFARAVLLQQLKVWSLLTVSTCFIRGQVLHKQTRWVRGIIFLF